MKTCPSINGEQDNLSLPATPDEFLHHGLNAEESLVADGLDPAGGEEEAVAAGVGQLDGVGEGDAERALRPVIAAT